LRECKGETAKRIVKKRDTKTIQASIYSHDMLQIEACAIL